MRISMLSLICFLWSFAINAQMDQPKLIVGIVIDQMKPEYLTRYQKNYGPHGFKRMMKDGYECKNTHFNYVPTYTGPGHASIFTGTTPSMHGIIANNFYDKFLKKRIYCAGDTTVQETDGDSDAGKMSAARILVTTITDELKMANDKSKVIAISMKDRASTFPAGHFADGAYWLNGEKFISSTAYVPTMPKWVNDFNNKKLVLEYLSEPWELLYEKNRYVTKLDNSPYEGLFKDEKSPVFPHDLPSIYKAVDNANIIKGTPFGNTISVDMAIAAIDGEDLGMDDHMDMLNISFSSTDYIGHDYGTRALEIEDTYYRLDQDIARLFDYLDEKVGAGKYTVFLTSDHGAAIPPGYYQENNIPGGFFDYDSLQIVLETTLDETYKKRDWIENMSGKYIYFNQKEIAKRKINPVDFYRTVKNMLLNYPGIYKAYDRISLMENDYSDWLGSRVKNGYNDKYSPDIIFLLNPGYISDSYVKYGTTHGSGYTYDTHVPLIWMGYRIPKGSSNSLISITDIVPTLSTLFDIPLPSGCTGNAINFK